MMFTYRGALIKENIQSMEQSCVFVEVSNKNTFVRIFLVAIYLAFIGNKLAEWFTL